jgi:hypothetical protein
MSYFKSDARESKYLVDRVPVYVFPAFVGSGRILLGMALAGLTTVILMHSKAAGEPLFWWLAVLAYLSSVILVVSGIYAINVVPPATSHALPAEPPARPPGPLRRAGETPALSGPAAPTSSHATVTRLGDLLVNHWRVITPQQLKLAQVQQENTGRQLSYVLTRMGLLTDETLEQILGLQAAAQDPWHDAPRHD